tara:strand:- start:28 stop:1422 length:1395 start_codon:yes stop_codon:yes gene_type:complete
MKNNIWILTEERPKKKVIKKILDIYCNDRKIIPEKSATNILPLIKFGAKFAHRYKFLGYKINGIDNIFLRTVGGFSSFADFLLFESEKEPNPEEQFKNCLYIIEETKTGSGSKGSRNSSAAQRATKFAWLYHQKKTKSYDYELIMLYNKPDDQMKKDPISVRSIKQCLKSIGVKMIGDNSSSLKELQSFKDVIKAVNSKPLPQKGNTPVRITEKSSNHLYLSGTLSKPKEKGNISYDPNIGGHIGIITALRHLGYLGQITITDHKVKQSTINNMRGNKYTFATGFLDFNLEGIKIPNKLQEKANDKYWYYEEKTEKTASILLHLLCNYLDDYHLIYENHAGAERGYFYKPNGDYEAIPKKHNNLNINLPDYVFKDEDNKKIFVLEGEMGKNLRKGQEQLKGFNLFEELYIKKFYRNYSIFRGIILSNSEEYYSDPEIIFAITKKNKILTSKHCPKKIRDFINQP